MSEISDAVEALDHRLDLRRRSDVNHDVLLRGKAKIVADVGVERIGHRDAQDLTVEVERQDALETRASAAAPG